MKAIITVFGADKPGIIAKVSNALYEANVNILDLSQTVMTGDVFVMNMQVDLEKMTGTFDELNASLEACGKELGLEVKLQRQEIFDVMYRV